MSRPNVLWITLDSVRADHTSLDGYGRSTTPSLSELRTQGLGFRNCIAHGRSTLPSSGAILTGLAPSRTTLGITGDVLPNGIRTIPQRFANEGYLTAALSGNSFVGSETGLHRGFEHYQWLTSSRLHQVGPRILLRYLRNLWRHSAGFTLDSAKHSTPFLMNQVAKQWLRNFDEDERPFFFYLHYNEPHRPYYPPKDYLNLFTEDIEMSASEAAESALRIHRNLNDIIANGTNLTTAEYDALEAMYDAEIAYTDEMIGRLITWIREQGLGDTVVVVTADHGELFGEYGLLSHKYVLHDAVTRVPLVIAKIGEPETEFGSSFSVGEDDIIQHADVMRTLLSIADVDESGTIGVNLRREKREFAISQRGPPDFEQMYQYNPDYDTDRFHDGVLTALRTPEWKYLKSEKRTELFALPDESTNVSADHPSAADRLDELLESWLDQHGEPIGESRKGTFSSAAKRQLRELGYID